MTTNQKGAIAETAIALEAVKLGVEVYRPIGEGGRYDLILCVDQLLRVQCKWAARRGDVLDIPCVSCWRSRDAYVRRTYLPTEIDGIAAYSPDLDRCYFVSIDRIAGKPAIRLRIAPTRNNQRLRINWARDFELAAKLAPTGP